MAAQKTENLKNYKKAAAAARQHQKPLHPTGGKKAWHTKKPSTNKPDIKVKKATYSKALRAAVLASAGARQRLIEMGGENTINIIRDFDRDMSDEELARKTNIKASDVRVVLNRLHGCGLFTYTRIRDKESGWYSYIWKMSEGRLKDFSGGAGKEDLGERSVAFEGEVYCCAQCGLDEFVGFDRAVDLQFKCDRCGSALDFLERKRK